MDECQKVSAFNFDRERNDYGPFTYSVNRTMFIILSDFYERTVVRNRYFVEIMMYLLNGKRYLSEMSYLLDDLNAIKVIGNL